ncbi:putative deoxyuridine 5'-triphosphate nucleotidohydrolase YncF [bioreactor metagenome]|uniref:dUTP diphosphatase n=1 Tax=bioreactor metagenome TaxID=1076179 RepID=A0A645AYF5_9ZZZZ
MKLKIKRFDKSLPLPVHKTAGAVAVDLYSREEITIEPHQLGYVPMNVALEIPDGYFVMMASRSSTHKMGITGVNGVGIFDRDFCGDNDEYRYVAFNFTDKPVFIEKGTRLCQLLLIKCENFDFEEVEHLGNTDRGGFGTTGVK